MKKSDRKVKKKRILAMSAKEQILMNQIILGLSLVGIKSFSEACRKLNVNHSNGRRAVLGHSQGDAAQKIKANILKMANIKPPRIRTNRKTTTGETSCQTN